MPFEKYVPAKPKKASEASIKSTGIIAIPSAFAAEHGLKEAPSATLHFDKERKLIGVKPTANPREEGAFKLLHQQRVSSLRARPFLDHYGIPLGQTKHFPLHFDAEEGMAVIALGELKRRPGRRRSQARTGKTGRKK